MIKINITLVRAKKNGEPVAVFNRVDDIVNLGQKIDQVTDPSICQYADHQIKIEFGILFPLGSYDCDDPYGCDDEIIESGKMIYDMQTVIAEAFKCKKLKWADMPCISYLGDCELDERFTDAIEGPF
jgi:hypothetical protein